MVTRRQPAPFQVSKRHGKHTRKNELSIMQMPVSYRDGITSSASASPIPECARCRKPSRLHEPMASLLSGRRQSVGFRPHPLCLPCCHGVEGSTKTRVCRRCVPRALRAVSPFWDRWDEEIGFRSVTEPREDPMARSISVGMLRDLGGSGRVPCHVWNQRWVLRGWKDPLAEEDSPPIFREPPNIFGSLDRGRTLSRHAHAMECYHSVLDKCDDSHKLRSIKGRNHARTAFCV
eukprot:TRINITY_DN24055_c0_g1_i1.p2 TRINITY_DN24055_c0_g1~~TRINITY_DN24055_c0_g1_i1.p2  ORF type:complete len:233 (-),score=23.81 TRINITY_DN24055_c0_g1_i1:168-866(-)